MQGASDIRPAGRGAAIDVIASSRDRDRAFRVARRHTWQVRMLRLLLPVVGVCSFGYFAASLFVASRLQVKGVQFEAMKIDPTNLVMADPRYSGFSNDGSPYRIHAKSAVTDLKNSAPVRLDLIDGELQQASGVVTRLKAKRGTYDQKKEILELYEKIDIDGSDGMQARLTRATVMTKDNRISSDQPVVAHSATGDIRANTMVLDTRAHKAAFKEAVEVVLRPKPADPAAQPKSERRPVAGLEMNTGEPIVVNSRTLDVDDTAKTALFREAVVARQGESHIEAPELDVLYQGQAALARPAAANPMAPAGGATQLKELRARGGVVMTSKESRAESATLHYDAASELVTLDGNVVITQPPGKRIASANAQFDQKADTALLTGGVIVNQDRNVMRSGRLFVDRKAGTAKLTSPPGPGTAGGRVFTLFFQGDPQKPGAARQPAANEGDAGGLLGGLGTGFKSDPNAPIEVEAATLDVNDRKHLAVYVGAVVAKQASFVVKTEELTAHFAGDLGLLATAADAPKAAKTAAGAPGGANLRRIEARHGVAVTGTDGQQATGEWANFDVKANTVVMGGKVTVTQGKQLIRAPDGNVLVIDLTSGEARLEADPRAVTAHKAGGPQVSEAFATAVAPAAGAKVTNPSGCPPGAICRSGRLEAIFYPNQLQKSKVTVTGPKPGADGDKAPVTGERKVKARPPQGSSWSATTTPGQP